MSKRSRNVGMGVLLAGLAGYAIGVLTAPKSGKETRADIKNKARKAQIEAEKKLKQLNSELTELIDKGKQRAKTVSASTKDELNDALKKAQKAKSKAREMLSAIHEGDADDEDLKVAVKDINSALQHLKKYVRKDVKAAK